MDKLTKEQTHRPDMNFEDRLFDMLGAYTIIRNGITLFPNPNGITDKYIPDEIRAEIHREVVDRIIALAHHEIEKLILGEEEIEEIIKNYFGYKNIASLVYNMGFGCSLAHAIVEAQKEKE